MDRLEKIDEAKTPLGSKNPITTNLPLEDRLRIIANLVVDRIVEEQDKSVSTSSGISKDHG